LRVSFKKQAGMDWSSMLLSSSDITDVVPLQGSLGHPAPIVRSRIRMLGAI
jgi:hypothetical protein